jgi:hypothetical protein
MDFDDLLFERFLNPERMGFNAYFLIVWDFEAQKNGMFYKAPGPRGSARAPRRAPVMGWPGRFGVRIRSSHGLARRAHPPVPMVPAPLTPRSAPRSGPAGASPATTAGGCTVRPRRVAHPVRARRGRP